MPNIFPPIQLAQPVLDGSIQPQDNVPVPAGPLGSVSAPSGASLALNGADSTLQAAQDKYASDAPKKYDYSAHGVLGNVGHVLARAGNIVGDVLDPAATSLIPNSDLYNAHKRAGDMEEVDKAQARQLEAQRESDSVGNEQANRDQSASQFAAGQPQRDATLAATEAGTAKTQEESKPLDANSAATLNHLYNSKAFTAGMSPEETTRLTEAHKTIAEMKARQEEFQQRQQQQAQTHQDTEKDRALSRDIAVMNHQDTEKDRQAAHDEKQTAAQEKVNKPYQDILDNVDEAHEFAKQNTGYGDYGLVMKFVDATKPKSGFRFNNTEANQIYGAASIADRFRRAYEHGATGTLLAPEQRQQILQALEVPKAAATKHMAQGSSGNIPAAGANIIDFTQLGKK